MSVPTQPSGALLDIAIARPPVTIDELLGPGDLLVVAPHPDDETLGCGAALIAALARGTRVTVALLTDGGGSHPSSRRFPADALKSLRRAEFFAAIDTLAAAAGAPRPEVVALGLPDTDVAGATEAAVAALSAIPDVGTVWCTWRGDPHCDHVAAAAIVDAVEAGRGGRVARFDYAVWGRFGAAGADLDPACVRPFAPGLHAAAKRAAMAYYRSQLTPLIDDDPDGFVMPPALTEHFAVAPEIFVTVP